jgi:hypothetical protein
MKKAFGIISLLATSAGVLAIPAAARDRADNRYTAAYTEGWYGHARERGRDFRQMDWRELGYRGEMGYRGDVDYRGEMGYRRDLGNRGDMGNRGDTGYRGDLGNRGDMGNRGADRNWR